MAFTPELYACGIDYVGVSNLFTFMKTIPPYWKPFLDMMYEMVGDPEKDSTLLASASPVFHVDQIQSPLLVIQGGENTLAVTLEDIIYHTRAVRRGAKRAHVVADMPFMSYQDDPVQALRSAGRLVKEVGAESVKEERRGQRLR